MWGSKPPRRPTWENELPGWGSPHPGGLTICRSLTNWWSPQGRGPDQPTLKEQGNAPLRRMTTGLKEVDGSGGGPGGSEGFPA